VLVILIGISYYDVEMISAGHAIHKSHNDRLGHSSNIMGFIFYFINDNLSYHSFLTQHFNIINSS
jgi:hypothetical protein